jgi:hypothetical protein
LQVENHDTTKLESQHENPLKREIHGMLVKKSTVAFQPSLNTVAKLDTIIFV